MKLYKLKHKRCFSIFLASFALILLLLSIITMRLAIAYHQSPYPQAILTLGGGPDREEFTAQFAKNNPSLKIWVSSGIDTEEALGIFRRAGISETRVHLDRRAADTVTNFTSLVEDFKRENIQHVYLITSDFHMPRAKAIATVVFGSQGIAFTPISIPSNQPPESKVRVLRDLGRAFVWVITRRTGASLNPILGLSCKIKLSECKK